MARGKFGADSNDIVTALEDGQTLIKKATSYLGQKPAFWGRYFKTPGNTNRAQYQAKLENQALHAEGILVLPLGRQTPRVGGSEADGQFDARGNAEAIIKSFGVEYLKSKGEEFFVFLDVEPSVPMSLKYWVGWASTITSHSRELSADRFKFLPCVYLNVGDHKTIQSINTASQSHGINCRGIWTAHYFKEKDELKCHRPTDWRADLAKPEITVRAPLLIWQYIGDCFKTGVLDFNQTNPEIDAENELLKFLILPPSATE